MLSRPARETPTARRLSRTTPRHGATAERQRPRLIQLLKLLSLALVTMMGARIVLPSLSVAPSLVALDRAGGPSGSWVTSVSASEHQWQDGATRDSDRPDTAEEADDDDLDDDLEASAGVAHDVAIAFHHVGPLPGGAHASAATYGDPSRFAIATDLARGPPA